MLKFEDWRQQKSPWEVRSVLRPQSRHSGCDPDKRWTSLKCLIWGRSLKYCMQIELMLQNWEDSKGRTQARLGDIGCRVPCMQCQSKQTNFFLIFKINVSGTGAGIQCYTFISIMPPQISIVFNLWWQAKLASFERILPEVHDTHYRNFIHIMTRHPL